MYSKIVINNHILRLSLYKFILFNLIKYLPIITKMSYKLKVAFYKMMLKKHMIKYFLSQIAAHGGYIYETKYEELA